ncbi:hypothetical protein CFP56_012212 [Quercus suber]|uniref:Uncharacterized protein n=1 Tax=Quercus suber TaxID=58331 RepID=A0AAW0M542_QUESU
MEVTTATPIKVAIGAEHETQQICFIHGLRLKWEKSMPKEDLHIKQAAALVVKLEGNSLFSSGNISGAASKYSEALAFNRAQCYLLLQQPLFAISDATRAFVFTILLTVMPKAYDMLGLAKESLLDAILFINECSQSNDPDLSLRQNKVPDYAERLVKKQMRAAWLFREAAIKHGVSIVRVMLVTSMAERLMIPSGRQLVKVILEMMKR